MTDPRIEAAAWMIGSVSDLAPGGDWEKLAPHQKTHFRRLAKVALEAADAAAWRPLTDQPPSERVLIMSQHGAAVAQWDAKIDGWRNEDTMYSPRYFTHWQPLPAPPVNSDALGGRDG